MIEISDTAKVSKLADIEDSVKGTKIIIGEGVVIDSFVKIKPAGGLGDLIIGKDSVINAGVIIYTGNGITIGENVMIGANTILSAATHEFRSKDLPIRKQGFVEPSPLFIGRKGIVIEDDVFIGGNSVILEGAHIKKGAVISAVSIIKGVIKEYGIYAGTPLKCVGYRQ